MAADTAPERLARLARLRWMIELDYRQLKGELSLDHYEGRSYLGFHHHSRSSAPPTVSSPWSGRTQITSGRPDPPTGSPTVPAPFQVLDRPLQHLQSDDQPADLPLHLPPQRE